MTRSARLDVSATTARTTPAMAWDRCPAPSPTPPQPRRGTKSSTLRSRHSHLSPGCEKQSRFHGLGFRSLGIDRRRPGLFPGRSAIQAGSLKRCRASPLAKPRCEYSIAVKPVARDHRQILSATRSLALRALGFRLISASDGTAGFFVNNFSSFFWPHWHCEVPGGQTHSWLRQRNVSFTILSSSE